MAENFKNQGNDSFKQGKKFYKDALVFYTNGIDVGCKDDKLNETLYVNRAAVNLQFGMPPPVPHNESMARTRHTLELFS